MQQTADAMVWDWPLRAFHWLLAACVAGSFATHHAGVEWFAWHRSFGYAVLVLVLFRIAWGWVGTRHARFRSFVRGPRAVREYLCDPAVRRGSGHNPLGALSVLAFLAVLLGQASTGLFANDEIANAGPFYGWVSHATSNRLAGTHGRLADVIVALVAVHLVAIAWHERRGAGGLVRAMLTGRKAGVTDGIDGSRGGLALLVVLVLVAALVVAVRAAPEASVNFF